MVRPASERFGQLDPDKLRGGYYTPPKIAQWLALWGVRDRNESILEPSCGDGSFLAAAASRLRELGSSPAEAVDKVAGVELLPEAAGKAAKALSKAAGVSLARGKRRVHEGEFFEWLNLNSNLRYECVLGNPPFIRYQSFVEPARSRAMDLLRRLGLRPNKLTNSWVPFVAAGTEVLRPGGRLGMVVPAELLQVSYAAQLRELLVERFERIDVVACNELFFEGAEQEVVLLLGDGAREPSKGRCRVSMVGTDAVAEVLAREPQALLATAEPKVVQHDGEKWLKYFLAPKQISLMRELRAASQGEGPVATLGRHAEVNVGVVTGKNAYFVLNAVEVDEYGLSDLVQPLVGRSVQLSGAQLSRSEWTKLSKSGARVHLLAVPKTRKKPLHAAGRRYVAAGESDGVHLGYKCSIREPWYSVPSIWVPDAFMFRQIYDFPRVVLNRAGATSTDTIHRVRCRAGVDSASLAKSCYTYLTAASAEVEGRSYGGGVLELEPTEATRLLVPAALDVGMPLNECDRLIRAGRLADVLEENNRLIMRGELGLTTGDCAKLRGIWDLMRNRRLARRASSPSKARKKKSSDV